VSAVPENRLIVVGSGDSARSELVAQIYAGALAHDGADVRTDLNLGARTDYLTALDGGRVTLVPEQSGAYLIHLAPNAAATDPDDVYVELNRSLPEGISVSDYAEAQWVAESGEAASGKAGRAENVLPAFRTGELTQAQIQRLNVVAGELTTTGLTEMAEAVADGAPSAEVAGTWLGVHGL
jgi:glycine betaine/choline ABC-type transport system substrate-binding protein